MTRRRASQRPTPNRGSSKAGSSYVAPRLSAQCEGRTSSMRWLTRLRLLQFLAKQLQAAAEKLVRLEKVHKEKQEAAQQALVEAKSDRTAAEKEREEAKAKIEENEKFIRAMQKKVRTTTRSPHTRHTTRHETC